jgi:hypothetical protein
MTEKNKVVMGVCKTRKDVERAVEVLRRKGFSTADISVVAPELSGAQKIVHEEATKAPQGAVTGASAGAVIGGTIGFLAGAGALLIPGIGPFIAAGPILGILAGAGVGGAVGGVGGALVGLGIPEYEAKRYESYVKNGGILISIHTENTEEVGRAKRCLELCDATDIYSTDERKGVDAPKGDWSSAQAPFRDTSVGRDPTATR